MVVRTMVVYLSNAFSLAMIKDKEGTIKFREHSLEEAKEILEKGFISAIGHESTAVILSTLLGINVSVNRIAINLSKEDKLVVFQLLERLPEGKILSKEELMDLINKGKAKFYIVELF